MSPPTGTGNKTLAKFKQRNEDFANQIDMKLKMVF